MVIVERWPLGSLSNNVFERHTSTGSHPFSFFNDGFAQIFSQIVPIRVRKLRNTNFLLSRHIKKEKALLLVDVRCLNMPVLKLPIVRGEGGVGVLYDKCFRECNMFIVLSSCLLYPIMVIQS